MGRRRRRVPHAPRGGPRRTRTPRTTRSISAWPSKARRSERRLATRSSSWPAASRTAQGAGGSGARGEPGRVPRGLDGSRRHRRHASRASRHRGRRSPRRPGVARARPGRARRGHGRRRKTSSTASSCPISSTTAPATCSPSPSPQLRFALGELRRVRSERSSFDPLPADFLDKLEERCGGLLEAQAAYALAVRSIDPHWAAMSGYRVGEMYRVLHRDLMQIPPPARSKTDKPEADLLRVHARPLPGAAREGPQGAGADDRPRRAHGRLVALDPASP